MAGGEAAAVRCGRPGRTAMTAPAFTRADAADAAAPAGRPGWRAWLGGWRGVVAAALLGAVGALALPPVHAVPVLLVAVPGLLWLVGGAGSWRRAAVLGFAWGWGHHLAGIHWITFALFTDIGRWWWLVPLAAPGLALPLALFVAPAAVAAWALPAGWRRSLGFAAAFVAGELLRGFAFTGFPWNLVGTVWAFAAFPVQGAALAGVHGLSLATLWLAALPLLRHRAAWAAGAAVVAVLAGFGAWRLGQPAPPAPGVTLLLVQGNVPQDTKWREDQRLPIFRRYLDLTAAGLVGLTGPVAVLWPETASPFLLGQDPEAMRLAAAVLPGDATLLAGTVRAEWDADGRVARVFNSLVALDPTARAVAGYDKAHLVPFGEYMPLAGLLPIRLVAGGMDFSAGPGAVAVAAPGLPAFGALICYEVIFPGAVAPSPRPAWLVNVTNDAWFGDSAGPWQHLAAARLRAVEEGLPLARAAQTGISAVFDASGRRLVAMPLGRTGTVATALPGAGSAGLFATFGLFVPLALVLVAGGAACWGVRWRTDSAADAG